MAFWSENYNAQSKDPKRGFRFQITFRGLNGSEIVWFAKKVGKPSYTITESKHSYLNHNFYFPGRVEWDTISMTLVDPVSPGAVAQTNALVVASGYQIPGNSADLSSMSKGKSVAAVGYLLIEQIDAEGDVTEAWTLKNPFIKAVNFGELDYENDDLTEIEIELRYDWAVCEIGTAADGAQTGLTNQLGTIPDNKTFYDN
tara:strand:+ start:4176 stop:4775 length:600 start_codon:yes stop_codon:yes gene_type:complete